MSEWVDWSERSEYMFARHGVSTAQANEAIADVNRLWIEPDYNSISGQSIRVIGWCESRGQVLSILLVRDEGKLWGANGYKSNSQDRARYHGKVGDHEQDL